MIRFALVAFLALAPLAGAQPVTCLFAEQPAVVAASLCDPSLPGVDLPDALADVQVTALSLYLDGDRWRVDLRLFAPHHPGAVRVVLWRYDVTAARTWIGPAGAARSVAYESLDAGPADAEPHALVVEWTAHGSTWHRWIALHVRRSGTYYFTAGEGALAPVE